MSEENEVELDETTETEVEESEVDTSEETETEGKEKPAEKKEEVSTYLDFDKPETLTPERVKARIDAETRRKHEQDRETRELRQELERLKREAHEARKPQEVKAPDVDLAYENAEEFKRQNAAYAEAIRKQAEWEYQQKELASQHQQAQEQEKQQKAEAFYERAQKTGIDRNSIDMSANIIGTVLRQNARSEADAARHQEVMRFVIDHDYGHQLMVDLAKNPAEMQEIANLSATQAAVKLNEKARSYQKSLKSKAPPPDDPLRGNGAAPQSRGPKGAKFE